MSDAVEYPPQSDAPPAPAGAGDASFWYLLCTTPLSDLMCGRLTGPIRRASTVAQPQLPAALLALANDVAQRTRLWRSERLDVAREIAALIAPAGAGKDSLRGMPLLMTPARGVPSATQPAAGIYLATRPSDAELDRLIAWSIAHGVILYSPFEGHVERGAAGGLALEEKVRLYINAGTLEKSGVELKPRAHLSFDVTVFYKDLDEQVRRS